MTRKEAAEKLLMNGNVDDIVICITWTEFGVMQAFRDLYCGQINTEKEVNEYYDLLYKDRKEFCTEVLTIAAKYHDSVFGLSWNEIESYIASIIEKYKINSDDIVEPF